MLEGHFFSALDPAELLSDFLPQFLTARGQLGVIALDARLVEESENRTLGQLPAFDRADHQGVGLHLAHAKLLDVAVDVNLPAVGVVGIIQLQPAAGFQVVDPGEPVGFDEVVIEPKPGDREVVGRPACGLTDLLEVLQQLVGNMQAAWVMVAAHQEHALLAAAFHLGKALGHAPAQI